MPSQRICFTLLEKYLKLLQSKTDPNHPTFFIAREMLIATLENRAFLDPDLAKSLNDIRCDLRSIATFLYNHPLDSSSLKKLEFLLKSLDGKILELCKQKGISNDNS